MCVTICYIIPWLSLRKPVELNSLQLFFNFLFGDFKFINISWYVLSLNFREWSKETVSTFCSKLCDELDIKHKYKLTASCGLFLKLFMEIDSQLKVNTSTFYYSLISNPHLAIKHFQEYLNRDTVWFLVNNTLERDFQINFNIFLLHLFWFKFKGQKYLLQGDVFFI